MGRWAFPWPKGPMYFLPMPRIRMAPAENYNYFLHNALLNYVKGEKLDALREWAECMKDDVRVKFMIHVLFWGMAKRKSFWQFILFARYLYKFPQDLLTFMSHFDEENRIMSYGKLKELYAGSDEVLEKLRPYIHRTVEAAEDVHLWDKTVKGLSMENKEAFKNLLRDPHTFDVLKKHLDAVRNTSGRIVTRSFKWVGFARGKSALKYNIFRAKAILVNLVDYVYDTLDIETFRSIIKFMRWKGIRIHNFKGVIHRASEFVEAERKLRGNFDWRDICKAGVRLPKDE